MRLVVTLIEDKGRLLNVSFVTKVRPQHAQTNVHSRGRSPVLHTHTPVLVSLTQTLHEGRSTSFHKKPQGAVTIVCR